MTRTGIFGGSFNPIHSGHIALAREILRQTHLDEIWMMVSPLNPLKQQSELLSDEKRLFLARRALENEPQLYASDYEFRLPRPSYTWHTLESLRRDEPDRQLHLIIGGDNWENFHRWYCCDELLKHYPIIVYPRRSDDASAAKHQYENAAITATADANAAKLTLVEAPLLDISSTLIRQRVQQGKPITGLVPDNIEADVVRFYSHHAAVSPKPSAKSPKSSTVSPKPSNDSRP